jgi:hypothetical protein
MGPSRTIRIEPISDCRAGRRLAGVSAGAPGGGEPPPFLEPAPPTDPDRPAGAGLWSVPDLIEPVIAYRAFRAMGARLQSPYMRVLWDEPTLAAVCGRSGESAHPAPHPGCSCGIYAAFRPALDFARIDYRGVIGIVSLWGRVEVHEAGMRAEHARVEALSVYHRWHRRQKRAVATIAEELAVDLVELDRIEEGATRYGEPLPPALHLDPSSARSSSPLPRNAQLVSAAS